MITFDLMKFGYRIRTRSGSMVDGLSIHARSPEEALRRLNQMYPGCQVVESWQGTSHLGPQGTSFEDVADLINPSGH